MHGDVHEAIIPIGTPPGGTGYRRRALAGHSREHDALAQRGWDNQYLCALLAAIMVGWRVCLQLDRFGFLCCGCFAGPFVE